MMRSLLAVSATALVVQICVLTVTCACGLCFLCLEGCINAAKPLVRVPGPIDLIPDIYLSTLAVAISATVDAEGDSDSTATSLYIPVVIVSAAGYFFQLSNRATQFRDLVRVGCTTALAAYWEPTFGTESPVDFGPALVVAAVLYALFGLVNLRHSE